MMPMRSAIQGKTPAEIRQLKEGLNLFCFVLFCFVLFCFVLFCFLVFLLDTDPNVQH